MPTPESIQAAASRRRLVLAYLDSYIAKHGYSPSQAEIARHTDVSLGTVTADLRWLADRDLITRTPRKPRTVRPTPTSLNR